ncbi:tyrosine-type recombinase/integrase [Caldimonas tepidiphila]|uniref:tyrosine-type recombinase/integrase n=1 Tax=Caldimonas tepidiphila TaxID=2315841 RepID=UPI00147535DC|nr:tyrosine-type recombinase/integrase [Caldimonas tepidiphila]
MPHIEKCRNLWYATLKVPAALRNKVGKTKFKQSLGTADKRRAQALAAPLVALWKAKLRQVAGEEDAVQREALRWREAIAEVKAAGDTEAVQLIQSLMAAEAENIEEQRGAHEAERFAGVASGHKTPTGLHFQEWKASITHLEQKTQDQYVKDVRHLVDQFAALEDITPQAGRRWMEQLQQSGTSPSSLKRMLSCWRSYWRYLGTIDAVPPNSFPFSRDNIREARRVPNDSWSPFAPADVPRLWQAAKEKRDGPLADLIMLGAYTGARIEELCSLELANVGPQSFRIKDAKTSAGWREVPIHSKLRPLMKRLREESRDGYLLTGLTFNKYGDRSNAISKRFGRLKSGLGFGENHVFHSLRKTLITLLEDAGVSENLAADIVGHEKPRITYGLYSGGASLATKAEAIERVRYEGLGP